MSRLHRSRMPLAVAALVMLSGCADPSAPTAKVLVTAPASYFDGGPGTTNYQNFTGQVWACPDTPYPVIGWAYKYIVVNNATNTTVASGIVKNLTSTRCVMLASVPTNVSGHYTVTVTEDPTGGFKTSNITADYGTNFPNTPPVATISGGGRTISSMISNDFGVVYVFWH